MVASKNSYDNYQKISLITIILAFMFVGMISTTFAELWLGFVFIIGNPLFSLIEMIVFYGLHVVFYYNLALKFHRTSFTALYWWGTLFGLYEAWTTTMVYYGYYNIIGHHGEFLGIAIYEYFANIYYWHPINSFILTIMAIQILFYPAFTTSREENTLPKTFVMNTKRNRWFWGMYFLYMAGMITSCTFGYEAPLILYFIGFYTLTLVIYIILQRHLKEKNMSPLHVLRIRNKGLVLVGGLIIIYYLFSFAVAVGGELIYGPILLFDLLALAYLLFVIFVFPYSHNINDLTKRYSLKSKTFLTILVYLGGTLVSIYYVFIFITIAWERVYNPIAFIIIFFTYLWTFFMIKQSRKTTNENDTLEMEQKPLPKELILFGLLIPLLISLLLRFVLLLAWLLSVFTVELTMALGISCLLVMSYNVFKMK